MKIIDYCVVYAHSESCESFSQRVIEMLNEGWVLYGYPFSQPFGLVQAFVKYEEK